MTNKKPDRGDSRVHFLSGSLYFSNYFSLIISYPENLSMLRPISYYVFYLIPICV